MNFEAMVQLASEIHLDNVSTNLYVMNDTYFLEVIFLGEESDKQIENQVSVVTEFAQKSVLTSDVLMEHGELIMENDAIVMTRRYFN